MPALVLLNATAGTIQRAGNEDFAAEVKAGFKTRGFEAEVRMLKGGDIAAAARDFIGQTGAVDGARVLVVGGGDGTIGSVAALAAGAGVTLGVLPLGTLNHFAKDLGLPATLDCAMDVIAAGAERNVDLAEVNGRIFVNNSSLGIYPFLVDERTAEQERRGVGKLAAIIPALIRTMRASSWQRVRIKVGNDERELRTPCVFVGNNFYDLSALGRRAELSAGELSVYVVKRQTWLGLALLPIKIAFGRAYADGDVELFRTSSLEIAARRRHLRVATDGETFEARTPLRYRTLPGALRVLAPAVVEPTAAGPAR